MKFLLDFFPIVLFFIAYKFFGNMPPQLVELANTLPFVSIDPKEPKDAIYFATLAIIVATIIQNISQLLIFKKLEKMHIISLFILLSFGTMTLAFKDPLFIKWKVSIFYWVFASVIFGSLFIGKKPLIEHMMSQAIEVPSKIWRTVSIGWGIFFAGVGVVNIFVAYNYSEDTWVNFKLFGTLGLTFVFIIAQGFYLAKHAIIDEDNDENGDDKTTKEANKMKTKEN